MNVRDAQQDLRSAYVGGGPGVIVSGLVWLAAGLVEQTQGIQTAFIVLFLGGMLIFPLTTLVVKFGFKRAKATAGNPLGATVMESTVAMIGGLVVAWLFLPYQPEWVFPAAAIAVGTHYAVFKTVYGDPIFWLLAGLITAVGFLGIFADLPLPGGPILAVAAIEIVFGLLLTLRGVGAPMRGSVTEQQQGGSVGDPN
ncbi:DUF7010 family protein [Brevundimonas sp.]|uniref:DUF7010 family protein n=1 Tax=Brevundimonas sp. TaxID=1871086 RepID=UPI00286B4BBA|nr:hypothetical protein [Brevundimonas sp.]